MNALFSVQTREIALVDEALFLASGGAELRFGRVEDDTVRLYASGPAESIRLLAHEIIHHHTSAATPAHSVAASE